MKSLIALVAMVAMASVVRAQSTIELKGSARLEPREAITLADVATLSGQEAVALGGVTLFAANQARGSKISIQDLRRILGQQPDVNWGRITLRGSTCAILAPIDESKKQAASKVQAAAAPADPNSVRRAVADRIARIVQAEPESLRLTFESSDDEVLNQSITGRTLEVKPTASSDRLPLAITLYDGDRIVLNKTIRVGVLVRRSVVIAAAAKARGELIAQGDITVDEQWVGPNLKVAAADGVVGSAAQGRIATGQIISVGDVAAPLIVQKGDQVAVSCVSGSVVLTTKARAMASGRVGDVIAFQGLEDKRTFTARMSGRGRAVVTVGAAPGGTETGS